MKSRKGAGQEGSENDYLHNISLMAVAGLVGWRKAGYAASMIMAYKREMGLIEERTRVASESVYYPAEEKARINLGEVTLDKILGPFESQYGLAYGYKFSQKAGEGLTYYFVWFSGAVIGWESEILEGAALGWHKAEAGDKVNIKKATIKNFSEYKGKKETHLTRCVVEQAKEN